METIPYSRIFKIDWRWIGLNFCFFVSFHLLPSHIIYLMRLISPKMGGLYANLDFWRNSSNKFSDRV